MIRLPIRRLIDDTSVRFKLLITPTLSIIALALVCVVAWHGFNAETVINVKIEKLTAYLLKPAAEARRQASGLQADMFRFIAAGLMGAPHSKLAAMGDEITKHDSALDQAVQTLAEGIDDATAQLRLKNALAVYHTQSSNAVVNFLNNLGWGATTARNAALSLDAVIAEAAAQERDGEARVNEAQREATATNERQKFRALLVLVGGSSATILVSLLVAYTISKPIRQLTAAMIGLAHEDYRTAIPATGRADEVGSMARAVAIFKNSLQYTEELARQQRATQAFLDSVLEHVPAPIFVEDAHDRCCVHANRAAETFLGVPKADLLGRTFADVMPGAMTGILSYDTAAFEAQEKMVEENVLLETVGRGQRIAMVTRLAIAGNDGRTSYVLSMMDDITERRLAETQIAHMAHHDGLTELPNRVLFAELLSKALQESRVGDTCVGVLGLDLDHFKDVNDTQGHAAGDELLRGVAQRLRACVRHRDTVARLGGDEFAVIQTGLRNIEGAKVLARDLIKAVRDPFDVNGQKTFIGLSVGIALSGPAISSSDLLKQADLALYEAKSQGRGVFRCFAPEMDARLKDQRALEHELRLAIGTEELFLHYQPQFDLDRGIILGAEALMRWTSPERGSVSPQTFIPLAEETGLIGQLGAWLMESACREAMRWPSTMHVAVNASPVQIRMPGFLGTVERALAVSGLPPERLELELTEGTLLRDTQETLDLLKALRALGVRLALDDFGTGYASLGYLMKFPFDKIKIDKSFIRHIDSDPQAGAIVRAVIDLGKALGVRIIAEGVERDDQVVALLAQGCREFQGFHFWKPMSADAIDDLMHEAHPRKSGPAPVPYPDLALAY